MRHIRYTQTVGTDSYTVIVAEEPLEQHISIVQHPELFDITEDELPEKYQFWLYE